MAAGPGTQEQWQPLVSFDAIFEAISFIEQTSVMRPVRYSLQCSMAADTLELAAQVGFAAELTHDANRLPLLLSHRLQVVDARVDGKACGVERSGDRLWLLTKESCSKGDTITCELTYRGCLPSAYVLREPTGIWAELAPQAFWYPFACWDATAQVPFELALDLPTGLIALSNGRTLEERQTTSGTHYVWSGPGGDPGIAVLAGPYAAHYALQGDLEVRTFVRPDMADQADDLVTMLERIVAFYLARFGRTPGGEIAVVVPPHSVGGNWALSHLIVAGQISPESTRPRRFGILAHEAAHQWWGHAVRFDFASALWLVEGLATFSELSARLTLEGERATRGHLACWTLTRYAAARQTKVALADCRADSPHSQELREDASAILLALLRQRMGAWAFDGHLRTFFAAHAGRTATSSAFLSAITDGLPEPLCRFVHSWLHDPLLPEVTADEVLAGIGDS